MKPLRNAKSQKFQLAVPEKNSEQKHDFGSILGPFDQKPKNIFFPNNLAASSFK